MYIKPINDISDKIVEQEWDAVADIRHRIIQNGEDISLLDVTEPFILESISNYGEGLSVLDCGCGTGHLTYLIAEKLDKKVYGIDISGKSIKIASQDYGDINNINYEKISIVDFSKRNIDFDMCIANMVLMDIVDIEKNIEAIHNMIKTGGCFFFTITHPCFWPIYWGYFSEPWFRYNSEIFINAPFQISKSLIGNTTHVHRPLSKYIELCKKSGFGIVEIKELYPTASHLEIDYKYDYPRFIGFVCKKL